MLAIIPARGGSVGLPNKNIKKFIDKPLIAHTIISALKSKKISNIVVTTDSKKIAEIVKKEINQKFNNKVVTNISIEKNYCIAEDYHQKYLEKK